MKVRTTGRPEDGKTGSAEAGKTGRWKDRKTKKLIGHWSLFALRLGLKDVNLVLSQARHADAPMPTGDLLKKQLDTCMENGFGEFDWTAIAMALK